jgi:hypothetical protein
VWDWVTYDPDSDRIPAFKECGNAAATALRFPVEAEDGVLTIAVREPDFSIGHPTSLELPKIAGISLRRVHDGGQSFIRGNADTEGTINLSDGVFTLNHLFLGGPVPPCLDAADADGNGKLNLSDAVYLFNHLFLGGAPPPAPYPGCGAVEGTLGCARFSPCE